MFILVPVFMICSGGMISQASLKPSNDILGKNEENVRIQTTVPVEEPKVFETDAVQDKQEKEKNADVREVSAEAESFLLEINQPDPKYRGAKVSLTEQDRKVLSHLIMGETGTEGFVGCALLAQSVRDAMLYFDYETVEETITSMQYSGWYSGEANQDVYDAISYIFDQGKSAVQHRLLVMYAENACEGDWHETQNFIVQYGVVRYFDYWRP